jgi:anaerobic magnesium-protoporphyrin IX monomethyl ester cyclase
MSILRTLNAGACAQSAEPLPVPGLPDSRMRPAKRVQLIFPPMVFPKFQSRQTALFPLGLGYIAAVLEQHGYELDLVDCPTEGYETITDIGKDRVVYGLTEDQIRARIEAFKPDAILLSCLFSTLEKRMLRIASIARDIDPNIMIATGGPHTSAYYKRLIAHPEIDFCVIGEGEEIITKLLEAANGKRALKDVDALCYRQDNHLVVQPRAGYIQNLDLVPHPARHLVDLNRYFAIAEPQGLRLDGESKRRVTQMTTSRGCPFQCKYCGKGVTWGKSYRTRSAANVLDEIEMLMERYGVEHIAFQDDNFTADMDRAEEICDMIVDRKLDLTWEGPNGLGVNYLSPELLEKMKASGCTSFTIAVESSNAATLRRVKKPNYIKLAPRIVQKAKELDIEVRGFFMIGFPGETLDEVYRTVEYARGLELAVTNFAIVTPLPGTPLFDEVVDAGLLNLDNVDFEDFAYGAFDVQLADVPNDQLKVIRKIEWMRTMFLDGEGNFKHNLQLKKRDVLDELSKGAALFPDNPEIVRMHQQAVAYYESDDNMLAAAS